MSETVSNVLVVGSFLTCLVCCGGVVLAALDDLWQRWRQ